MDAASDHDSCLLRAIERYRAPGKVSTKSYKCELNSIDIPQSSEGQTREQIAVVLDHTDALLLLDKTKLLAVSDWFLAECNAADARQSRLETAATAKYRSVKYLFVIGETDSDGVAGLTNVDLDYDIDTHIEHLRTKPSALVKNEEDVVMQETQAPTHETRKMSDLEKTYRGLFQLLKLTPSGVVKWYDNSTVESTCISQVVSLGTHLKMLPAIRSKMPAFWHFLGQRRWPAIKEDPPLWLCLALDLQDAEIYKEAATHIIGCQVRWLPTWTKAKDCIPENVLAVLERKADKLMLQVFSAIQGLNQATVTRAKKRLPAATAEKVSHVHCKDTWTVVCIWHDFFITTCAALDDGKGEYDISQMAGLFRIIERGGEAYLPMQATLESIEKSFPDNTDDALGTLTEMKRYASEVVKPLLKSGLQYKGWDDLGYLTCVEIEDRDIPFQTEIAEDNEF